MELLFEYFKNVQITIPNIRLFLKKNVNLQKQLRCKYLDYESRFTFFVFVKYYILGVADKKCLICGKLLNNQQIRKNANYCSLRCIGKSKKVKQKRKQTIFQKYSCENISQLQDVKVKKIETSLQHFGCLHHMQSDMVQQKIMHTNLYKYGTQYVLSNESIKQKIKKTNLQRYGCQNVSQSDQIKNKKQNSYLKKYGCNNSLKSNIVRQKIKKTNLQRYGFCNPSSNDKIRNKINQTNLKKYGFFCCLNNGQIKNKSIQTNKKRYGCQNYFQNKQFLRDKLNLSYHNLILKFKDYVVPMFSVQQYTGYNDNQIYKWKCKKCGNIFEQHIHISNVDGNVSYIPRCLNCFPYVSGFSYKQIQLFQFVCSFSNYKTIRNENKIIRPYQIDIYIPQKKLGIQFDGLIWHSNKFKKDDFNLLHKTQLCQKNGIKLIHVFEDQWLYQRQFVQKMIKLNFEQNVDILKYGKFENDKYIFDRRYFSKLDFKDYNISYIESQKFYIKNNTRIKENLDGLFYIYDCGKIIVK